MTDEKLEIYDTQPLNIKDGEKEENSTDFNTETTENETPGTNLEQTEPPRNLGKCEESPKLENPQRNLAGCEKFRAPKNCAREKVDTQLAESEVIDENLQQTERSGRLDEYEEPPKLTSVISESRDNEINNPERSEKSNEISENSVKSNDITSESSEAEGKNFEQISEQQAALQEIKVADDGKVYSVPINPEKELATTPIRNPQKSAKRSADNLDFAIAEAILFSSGTPVASENLCKILHISKKEVDKVMTGLKTKFEHPDSGIRIIKVNNKYQMCSKAEYSEYIREFMNVKPETLSGPAMEVLSIVAYYQPVTKAFIENVRGVNCRELINNLVSKFLIEEKGRLDIPGNPIIYGTTDNFLMSLGITSIEDLPPIPDKKETVNE